MVSFERRGTTLLSRQGRGRPDVLLFWGTCGRSQATLQRFFPFRWFRSFPCRIFTIDLLVTCSSYPSGSSCTPSALRALPPSAFSCFIWGACVFASSSLSTSSSSIVLPAVLQWAIHPLQLFNKPVALLTVTLLVLLLLSFWRLSCSSLWCRKAGRWWSHQRILLI